MTQALALLVMATASPSADRATPLDEVQLAVVKVYGAGGVARLEGYQTGLFLAEPRVVLTIDSPVLDASELTLIDAYGDRSTGRVTARDAATGLAIVEGGAAPRTVDFRDARPVESAQTLWVLSNAFNIASGDEPVTLQRARLAGAGPIPIGGQADARPRPGVPEQGTRVLLLDAITSNPGTPGGVVVTRRGAAVGVVGAECRSASTGAWINYALPAETVAAAIQRMRSDTAGDFDPTGRGPALRWRSQVRELGIAMLPSLIERTPAYVESVERASLAGRAGVEADDLVVAVDGATVGDVEGAGIAIARSLERRDSVELTLLRGRTVVTVTLSRGAP